MNNKNLQTEAGENEILTADGQKISELVGSLERVSAPNDFEFHLKARIAARKSDGYQAGYWQWLRYLLPVGASAFVLAFALYATNFFAPTQPDNNKADLAPTKQAEAVTPSIETSSNTMVAATNSHGAEDFPLDSNNQKITSSNNAKEKPILISDAANLKKKEPLKRTMEESGGGSRDSAITTPPVKLPFNLNPDKSIKKPQGFENSQALTTEEVLNGIGVETVSEGGKLKVKSIRQNSPAGLSGVKDGDVIEAIDDQIINVDSKRQRLRGAKKLTVLRDGKSVTIDLKSN